MSHSHMPVNHLLRQVAIYRSKRQQGTQNDVRPEWMTVFVESVADLFEPLADEGRVGFDCQFVDDRWVLEMYLGGTELVGGSNDGEMRYSMFQLDLHGLFERFEIIDRFRWNSIPDSLDDEEGTPRSSVMIEGRVGENTVRLHIYSIPPEDAGPGFREFPDGRVEPA